MGLLRGGRGNDIAMTDATTPETPAPQQPVTVGARLRAAREAQGLSVADVASRTRVTQRFLEALEDGDFSNLPSATYASGFARAYARAVGLDPSEIGRDIRAEIVHAALPPRVHHIEEIVDPARAPSRTVVVIGLAAALAVLVLAGLWLATSLFRGADQNAAPASAPTVVAAPAPDAPAQAGPVAPPTDAPVVLTATDEVWMRVYDAANATLYLGTMKPGETFTVPAGANDPQINVGRPDKLAITVGGKPVAPLGDGKRAIKDVKISGVALAGRATPLVPAPAR